MEIAHVKMLVFEERGKPEYLEKNLSEKRREPTTTSTHIWHRDQDLNLDHIGGRQVLSPVRHPLLSSRVGAKSRIPSRNLVFFQIQLHTCQPSRIIRESPGYDTNLPVSRTGRFISRIKSSFELFCALV